MLETAARIASEHSGLVDTSRGVFPFLFVTDVDAA